MTSAILRALVTGAETVREIYLRPYVTLLMVFAAYYWWDTAVLAPSSPLWACKMALVVCCIVLPPFHSLMKEQRERQQRREDRLLRLRRENRPQYQERWIQAASAALGVPVVEVAEQLGGLEVGALSLDPNGGLSFDPSEALPLAPNGGLSFEPLDALNSRAESFKDFDDSSSARHAPRTRGTIHTMLLALLIFTGLSGVPLFAFWLWLPTPICLLPPDADIDTVDTNL